MLHVLLGELIGLIAVVMVLGIPLSWSPVGRALAESIRARSNPSTETFRDLDARVKALEAELHQVRETIVLGDDRPRQRTLGAAEGQAGGTERGRQLER